MRDAGQDLAEAVNRGGKALIDSIRRAEDRINDEITGINKILSTSRFSINGSPTPTP